MVIRDRVRAIPAINRIGSRSPLENIVATTTLNPIITSPTVNVVVAGTADYGVISNPAI